MTARAVSHTVRVLIPARSSEKVASDFGLDGGLHRVL